MKIYYSPYLKDYIFQGAFDSEPNECYSNNGGWYFIPSYLGNNYLNKLVKLEAEFVVEVL
jgi:hypothetical protein